MNSHEIEQNVKNIFENFSKETFLYDLLLAYGTPKSSIVRLKKGDSNLSKAAGEILYKKKIFFKVEKGDKLLSSLENAGIEERIKRHTPRFAILTDFKQLAARDLKLNKNLDIPIEDLPNHFDFFLPLAGSEVYHAANDNKADREAFYKMGIAQKEANETEYWLELLYQSEYLEVAQYNSIILDIQELNKILASIIITSKEKKYGKR